MTTLQTVLAAVGAQAAPDPADPANFPAREVQVPRTGLVNTLGYGGLALGGIGVVGLGASLVRSLTSGGAMLLSMPVTIGLGAAALLGGAAFGGSRLIGPKSEHALAAGIPNEDMARRVDARVPGDTKIVECDDGTFAILRDNRPHYSGGGGGGSSSGGSRRPSGGGGGGYNPPSYPSTGGGGSTSRGDDSGSSRNSSSNGNPSSDDF
jgi:hypothetical protein